MGRHGLVNPYEHALYPLAALSGLFLPPALLALGLALAGRQDHPLMLPALIGTIAFAIFGLMLLAVWLLGRRQMGQIRAFLDSDRPLEHWFYTPEEWQEIQETIWRDEEGDWRVQFGCMAFLLGLVGLLVGVLLGIEEDLGQAVLWGAAGAAIGAMAGALLGALVAGGNYLAARRAYLRPRPDQVALGPDEIYANGVYFRGDGETRRIYEAKLEAGDPALLVVQAWGLEEWQIVVPARMVEAVQAAIPRLAPGVITTIH